MIRNLCLLFSLLIIARCTHLDNDKVVEPPVVQEASYYSTILDRNAEYLVLLPESYAKKKETGDRFPVLYLLHYLGGSHLGYLENYHLIEVFDTFDMLIVIPFDGTQSGWWLDNPEDSSSRISTWLTGEFKQLVDSLYSTLPGRSTTGIAGHSMGGFGALFHLEHFPQIYSAAFSAKGLLDITAHSREYMINTVLGETGEYPDRYRAADLFENALLLKDSPSAIMFYSGPNDWFGGENQRFDSLLTTLGVAHRYFENNENHPRMERVSTEKMICFFDSCFALGKIAAN